MGVAGPAVAMPTDDHVFLLGRPPIGELLGFIRNMALDGQNADQGALTQEWRDANDHLKAVEKDEAGIADSPPQMPLPAAMQPLADRVVADPVHQQAYRFVPTRVVLVELDRLVVFQKFINLGFVTALKGSLPIPPTDEDVARLAFCLDRPAPQVQFMQQGPNVYSAISPSNDFRFLEAKVVAPAQIPGLSSSGRPLACIVLTIGFGSNYLNALEVEGRLVLNNGSHRAYALRDMGLTHAPCIVQQVTRREELDLVASGDVQANPEPLPQGTAAAVAKGLLRSPASQGRAGSEEEPPCSGTVWLRAVGRPSHMRGLLTGINEAPMRFISWLVVSTFLGLTIYFGFSDSWPTAVLFFLLFCGWELVVLVLVPLIFGDRDA